MGMSVGISEMEATAYRGREKRNTLNQIFMMIVFVSGIMMIVLVSGTECVI